MTAVCYTFLFMAAQKFIKIRLRFARAIDRNLLLRFCGPECIQNTLILIGRLLVSSNSYKNLTVLLI